MLLLMTSATLNSWQRIIGWREEALRRLGSVRWLVAGAVFMGIVLALMRAAGRVDNSDL